MRWEVIQLEDSVKRKLDPNKRKGTLTILGHDFMVDYDMTVWLIEACLKEKEYDPYFSISLVLQGARNTFIREVGRHADIFANNVESSNSGN